MAPSTVVGGRGSSRVFYGWWIVLAAFIFQALSVGLLSQAFGAYFVNLQDEFGWSRTALSAAFAMSQLESGLLGPVQGWAVQRIGVRNMLRIGTVVFVVGLILISQIHSLWAFYGAYLIAAIGTGLSGYLTVNVALANWFEKKRGTAMGLAAAGWGAAGLIIIPVTWSLEAYGWRTTALASAAIALLVCLPVAQIMRDAPEPYGYRPDGAPPDETTPTGDRSGQAIAPGQDGFTLAEALRTKAFWFVAIGHAAALFMVSAVQVHLIPYLHQTKGLSLSAAAGIVSFMTIVQIAGQITGGLIGDRVERRLVAAACMVGHMVALLLLVVGWMPLVFVFAALNGLAWGMRGSLMTAIRADYFGRRSFATINGFSSMVITVGTIVGPVFAAQMADRLGDYRLGFVVLALLAGVGTFFFLGAKRPAPPLRPDPAPSTLGAS